MKTSHKNDLKTDNYTDKPIKENCIIEFLCLLTDKPVFSFKTMLEKIKKIFRN